VLASTGVTDDATLYAYRNPIRVFDLLDLIRLLGPDRAGKLQEVGRRARRGRRLHHSRMLARLKFLN